MIAFTPYHRCNPLPDNVLATQFFFEQFLQLHKFDLSMLLAR